MSLKATAPILPRPYWLLLAGMVSAMALAPLLPEGLVELPSVLFMPSHMLTELASVIVAAMVFGITWHSDGPGRPAALFWLACALFASAWLDFAHTMSYQGMPDLVSPANPEKAIYFWLAARSIVAATFLGVTFIPASADKGDRISYPMLAGYALVVAGVYWLVLFHQASLPRVYIPGEGLTPFKIGMEWLIVGLLAATAWRLRRRGDTLPGSDSATLLAAVLISILSEFCFSLYHTYSDAYSLLGHLFKIVAYGLIYQAVFVANVRAPYLALKARGEELAAAHERFRDLVETSPDWVWEVDAKGLYTYASPRVRELLGYGPEEVLGHAPFDFMPAAEARRVRLTFEAMMRMRLPFHGLENVNRRKNGREVVLETSGVPIFADNGEFAGYRGTDRDVTERVSGERALEAERVHLRTLVDTIPDLVWLKDPDGVYMACNPTFERFFGAKAAEIVGKTDYDYVDKAQADFFREHDRKAMQAGGPSVNEEWVEFAEDGRRALLHTIKTPMRDAAGRLIGVLGIARDITAVRQAETALRESEAQLNRAQAAAHVGSWHLDMRENVLTWSEENYRIFGLAVDTPLSYEAFLDRVHPDDRDQVDRTWQAALHGQPYDVEHRLLVDGRVRWVREKADLMFAPDGALIGGMGITQDITERKLAEIERERLERQLRQAQKMEALGQLTGGIAHDFNNILASIMGYARLAQARLDEDGDAKMSLYLGNVVASSERARDLIAKMLAYTRVRSNAQAGVLTPAPLARDALRMLKSTIPSSIELVERIDDRCPPLRIDAVELQQVLVNLVVNARDAIGEIGRIEIGLHLASEVGGLCALCQEAVTGEFVALEVIDSGAGIANDDLGRIFDPFFTTKDVGKGSGLGLSMVQGIVKKVGGHVLVHSRPGQGSVFRLLFPVADAVAVAAAVGAGSPNARPAAANARVWVVDDEAMVADFLDELLAGQGYRVRTFNRPVEALAAFREVPEGMDLVVIDQTMPGLTGGEMARAMLAARPDLPIFLCTGHSDHMDEARALDIGVRRFFHKPLDSEKLLAALAETLTGSASVS